MFGRGTRDNLRLPALALALALLPGCAPTPRTPAEPPSATRRAPAVPAQAEPLGERMMPFGRRQAEMPTGMPIEVPVIAGSVTSTSAPVSDSSWLYTIETTGTIDAVADWYRRAYANAGWVLVEGSPPGTGIISLRLRKGGAESVLRIGEAGAAVRVEASIGVGDRAPSAF